MSERTGFTSPNLHEAETNRALAQSGQRLVVVADHTKWGVVGIATVAGLDQADVLVCDDGLPRDARQQLWEHVDEVVLAGSTADVAEVPSA